MVDMSVLVGSVRRFGLYGPPYQVVEPGTPGPDGEARMLICLVESGETVDYPVADIMRDPLED